MSTLQSIVQRAKNAPATIALSEGTDERIVAAAVRAAADGIAKIALIGPTYDVNALLSAAGKIKLKQEVGVYQFFTADELERLAFEAGFSDISTCRSLGGQANVLRVVK